MTTTPDLEALGALLRETAETEIMPRFGRVAASGKADGSIVTAADLAAQDHVRAALAAAYPDIPLLAEEMSADEQEAGLVQRDRITGFRVYDADADAGQRVADLPALGPHLTEAGGAVVSCVDGHGR